MSHQSDQLWTILLQKGIVQGEQPTIAASRSPWYVKVLLAFSGWLAAIFMLCFFGVALTFIFRSSAVSGFAGTMLIGAAFALLRNPANDFVEHLGLATSLAGQALMTFAIFDIANDHIIAVWMLLGILQGALAVFMPNFVHRVFSTMVTAIAFSMVLYQMGIPYLIGGVVMFGAAFCWLNELRYLQHIKKVRAMGYGLILALIALKGTTLFGPKAFDQSFLQDQHLFWTQPWFGEGIIGAVTLYVVWRLLQWYRQPLYGPLSITALLATLIVCAVSMKVQGITVGMVIVCLGFFGANRVLIGLGIISLLFYISSYYYLLETTLLSKSQSLLLVGLVLLGIRWLMPRIVFPHKEVPHA